MSTPGGPVVYFPGVGWDEVSGTDKLLAQEVSRRRTVLWVDPPVPVQRWLREHGLRGLLRPVQITRRSPTLTTARVAGPPWPNRLVTWRLSERRAGRAARAALDTARRAGDTGDPVVVVATPQPRRRPRGRRVYYATDDFAAGAELMGVDRRTLAAWERRQLATAQVRLAVSPVLARRWSDAGYDGGVLPNGCDPGLRERVATAQPAPEVDLRGPVAGVVGQLSERLDPALLEAVVDAGFALLLVGPLDPALGRTPRMRSLLARDGVRWVGRQPLDRLPAYLKIMDVGLTPYRPTAFNQASIPLKTLEYLAAGLPVVSTPLPALDLLPDGLVATAGGPAEFAAAARRAVRGAATADFAARSLAFAQENSWSARADVLLAAVDGTAPAALRPGAH